MKKLLMLGVLLLVGAIVQPAVSDALFETDGTALAQVAPGDGGGEGCTPTCAPMPASCNESRVACDDLPGCNTCMCTTKDRNGNCTHWSEVMQSPKQK